MTETLLEQRAFGRAGLRLPVVGMGTWRTFDVQSATAEADRRAIVDTALTYGARVFDSSPMYGQAERVLGLALAGRREAAFVATKVWTPSVEEGRRQIDRALGYYAGRIDLYQVHNLVSWSQHLDTLEQLQQEGKVGLIGATHYDPAAFNELLRVMQSGRIQAIQIPYNPLEREVEQTILDAAQELGLGVLVMRPLGQSEVVRQSPAATELRPFEEFGISTWAQVLLKWCLSNPRVNVAIPATSRRQHMIDNVRAGRPPWLTAEARDRVASLVRGRRYWPSGPR